MRLIDAEGEQVGVVTIQDAMRQAADAGLDLVEISPQASPPVCRVMDYGKFQYQQSKKANAARKKQKQMQIKEIRLRLVTEEADYQTKLNKLKTFLDRGDKVKIAIRFRGREMAHPELGKELMKRIQTDLQAHGTAESFPKLEGRQMVMMVSPLSKK